MNIDTLLAIAKSSSYTDESLDGVGALKGVPCQIKSMTPIEGGTRITFLWVSNSGKEYEDYLDVMNGKDGKDGETGEDGKSAYECAVEKGYTGTEEEWLASLHGADGQDGKDGKDGKGGKNGADGKDGEDGRGIKESYINDKYHFIIVYDDDTEEDCGLITIPSINILPDTDTSRWTVGSGVTVNSSGDYGMDVTFSAKWQDVQMCFTVDEVAMLKGKDIHIQIDTGTFTNTALELVADGSSLKTINSADDVINITIPSNISSGLCLRVVANKTAETWTANFTGLFMGILDSSGGSGADAELESDVTSNISVGAIASGTTLPQGTTFTEFAQKLLISEIAPTIGFSLSKSGNVAYGSSYTEKLTVNVSNMGTAKKIKSIAWYEGSTLKQTDTIDSTTTGSWSYTMGTATTDSTTFKAIVTYTKSDDSDTTSTKTGSISFYYNKFYGAVGTLTPDEATVEALTSALATGKGGTYSFTTNASRICYAYPKSHGALTSIKDGNGFSLFDSFTRTEQTYTQNGTSVTYYRYVLTDPTTVSSYSVIFA